MREHALALDAPHDATKTVTCATCHIATASTPTYLQGPYTGDESYNNNLCMNCHNFFNPQGMNPDYSDILNHSSIQTGTANYGTWKVECVTCHNPHNQRQASVYAKDPLSSIVTGTQSGVGTGTVLTVSTVLSAGTLTNYILMPNTLYPAYMYRITGNTTNSITVEATGAGIPLGLRGAGKSFAVKYGKLVKETLAAPGVGPVAVKFFNNSGPNSFASSTTTIDGICQVCHAQTASFNRDGVQEGPGHPANVIANNQSCSECHQHKSGFKAGCKDCHGYPPLANTLGGADGLANSDGGTGSTTPGAHRKHVVTLGHACMTCHSGGMPASPVYDKQIQIGFNIASGAYQGGSYDGRNPLANGYSYTSGNPGTAISNTGAKSCSNIYCHGSTMAPNGGTDITPVWDDPSTASCGACHGASSSVPPTRGSHQRHAGSPNGLGLPCAECHATSPDDHVNGRAEWAFDTVSFPWLTGAEYREGGTGSSFPVPGAYGQCSNLYCHSSAQGITDPMQTPIYATPAWGQKFTGVCGAACHAVGYAHPSVAATYAPLTSGSHSAHLRYHFDQGGNCQSCHHDDAYSTCDGCHLRKNHVNRTISVAFNPEFPVAAGGASGTYTGDPAPGTAYGSCSDIYCHSPGTKGSPPYSAPNTASYQWGGALPLDCTGCHGGGQATGAAMTTASHERHVASYDYDCSKCHATTVAGATTLNPTIYTGTLIYGYRYHVNGWLNVAFSSGTSSNGTYAGQASPVLYKVPGSSYGVCSNTYCHSKGTSLATNAIESNTTPSWGAIAFPMVCSQWTGQSCITAGSGCHQFGYIYVSVPPSTLNYKSCSVCHGANTPGFLTKGSYPSNPHKCYGCHRFQPINAPDAPKANSHFTHTFSYPCNYCHYSTTTDGTTIANTANHANGSYDVVPDPNGLYGGKNVNFTYAFDPGGGKCTNINCHITRGIGSWKSWGGVSLNVSSAWQSGPSCWEVIFYNVSASGGTPPYTYFWDFGDGTTSTEQNPTHVFPSGATYTVTVTARDANRHPGTKTNTITPQPVNTAPVADMTVSVYGWTVTLTDLSYDTDYNACGHSGPGTLTIMWGDMYGGNPQTTEVINLTDAPSNRVYTHTYAKVANLPNAQIYDLIRDNAGVQTQKYKGVAIPTTYTIKGRVANAGGVGLNGAVVYLRTMSGATPAFGTSGLFTDANGNYSFTGTAVDGECYIVKQPTKNGYTFTPGDQTVCAASTTVNFTSSP